MEKNIYNECAMPFLELEHPAKGIINVPYRQYQLNDEQQFAVIAIDFKDGIELGEHEGINYDQIGKLEEQGFIFQQQIHNSLLSESWDFEKYPNPEVVLITKIDEQHDNS